MTIETWNDYSKTGGVADDGLVVWLALAKDLFYTDQKAWADLVGYFVASIIARNGCEQ